MNDLSPATADTATHIINLDRGVSLQEVEELARFRARLVLTKPAIGRVAAAHDRLATAVRENRHIYGITTGFGPLADRIVSGDDVAMLQQNLVHHLATGIGAPFDWANARAILLCRILSGVQGYSGLSPQALDLMITILNTGLAPEIPQKGTVGASGDLTPLAHMALVLQGRGNFLTDTGRRITAAEALAQAGSMPLTLCRRDGLAIVNGTSAMTGVAALNARKARRLVSWSLALSAALADILKGRAEAWAKEFAEVRPHPGQRRAAEVLRMRIASSQRIEEQPIATRILTGEDLGKADRVGQDAYTLRCVPQLVGAVIDTLDWHDRVVETEVNAVTDNPIFPPDRAVPALHGGNFMGSHVALASDAAHAAILTLAGLAERQIARLTDERLNEGLPAFLHRGRLGLNSGLMGAQVTATALLAELRSGAIPASAQSISTNGANQDVVSLGTIAARKLDAGLTDTAAILAILGIAIAQAGDLVDTKAGGGLAPATEGLCALIRTVSPPLVEDRPLGTDIADLGQLILLSDPPAAAPLSGSCAVR